MHNFFSKVKIDWLTGGVLFFLMVSGIWLRTYRLSEFMLWGDSARDVMVAARIIERGWPVYIFPLAAGGEGILLNSPFYYNFLALIWGVMGSPQGLAGTFALINSLVILINYKIGEELEGRDLGLILAFLTAFSHLPIEHSRSVFQPYLVPLVFTLSLYFLLRFFRPGRIPHWGWLAAAIGTWGWGFHLHYSVLSVAPLTLVVIGLGIRRLWRGRQRFAAVICSWWLVVIFGLWVAMTNHGGSLNLFDFGLAKLKNLPLFQPQLVERPSLLLLTQTLLEEPARHQTWLPLLLMGGIVIGSGVVLGRVFRQRAPRRFHYLFLGLGWMSLLWTQLFSSPIDPTYLMPIYYLFLLQIGIVIMMLAKIRRWTAAATLFLISYYLQSGNQIYFWPDAWNEFGQAQYVAAKVIADASVKNWSYPEISLFEKTKGLPVMNWNTPAYWYFLEQEYQVPLVELAVGFNNLKPIYHQPKVIYVVCRDYAGELPSVVAENCLLPVEKLVVSELVGGVTTLIGPADPETDLELYRLEARQRFEKLPWALRSPVVRQSKR